MKFWRYVWLMQNDYIRWSISIFSGDNFWSKNRTQPDPAHKNIEKNRTQSATIRPMDWRI